MEVRRAIAVTKQEANHRKRVEKANKVAVEADTVYSAFEFDYVPQIDFDATRINFLTKIGYNVEKSSMENQPTFSSYI